MKEFTAIDEYMAKVYKWVIIIITGACTSAGVTYTFFKLMGFYETVHWVPLLLFCASCFLYVGIGLFIIKKSIVNGVLLPEMAVKGKIFLVVILIIQFNYIMWLIPSREFWAFSFFFLILVAFFFDLKMIIAAIAGYAVTLAIVFVFRADVVLPEKDELFVPNLIVRGVCVTFSFASIYLIGWFASKFLVNAKRDELERNTNKTKLVLEKATGLTDRLATTSKVVMQNAQSESASTQELSAITEELLDISSLVLEHTKESISNLQRVKDSSTNVSEKIHRTDEISSQLVEISTSNENSLNDLLEISSEVADSNKATMKVIQELVNETEMIGATLNLINEIAESTNLLALNASIEAARAGDAGKGFAVVADEVGKLADSTKNSLKEVNSIIKRVQTGTSKAAESMSASTKYLNRQNDMLSNTVSEVKNMISLLKNSAAAIKEVDRLNQKQDELVDLTADFNSKITEQVTRENENFTNIAEMVQANTEEAMELMKQVDELNQVVTEMQTVLQ